MGDENDKREPALDVPSPVAVVVSASAGPDKRKAGRPRVRSPLSKDHTVYCRMGQARFETVKALAHDLQTSLSEAVGLCVEYGASVIRERRASPSIRPHIHPSVEGVASGINLQEQPIGLLRYAKENA